MTRKLKTRKTDRSSYRNYLKKAHNFFNAAQTCLSDKNYDGAALASIHCVISALDAFLVFHSGIKSVSDDHLDALVLRSVSGQADSSTAGRHAERVLMEKTAIEYLDASATEQQASEMFKHTERFFSWLKTCLPE